VSKRLGSRYRSGRSTDWLKFKNPEAPAVKREAEGTRGQGRPPKIGGLHKNLPNAPKTLDEQGVDENLAHRARRAWGMSEGIFRAVSHETPGHPRMPHGGQPQQKFSPARAVGVK